MKRLTRSQENKVLAGVCGGLGEYFDIDPIVFRLVFLFVPGINIITYFIMALMIPKDESYVKI